MRITNQEQKKRKEWIVHTAYELFCSQGIDAVPMTVIAQQSGISHASIYRYFKTKGELIHCTQKILWEEVVAHLLVSNKAQLYDAQSGFEQIEILLGGFRELYQQHASYILFSSDYKLYLVRHKLKITDQRYQEMLRPVSMIFKAALEKGQEDGTISQENSVNTLFLLIWGLMRGFIEQIVLYDAMYEGENPWKQQFDLTLYHILAMLKTA